MLNTYKILLPDHQVHLISSSRLALQILELLKGKGVHLVITGMNVGPDVDGNELARIIKENYPDMKVIIITGGEFPENHHADDILAKPFQLADFKEKIIALLPK